MTKLPISVCIISGAEGHRIGKCLESVVDWVEEIIVVLDDRAEDNTEEVVTQHGGRVYREPWKGHIAQKNSAAAKAQQPWILGLDADEVVSPELRHRIEATFRGKPEVHAAYRFPRCTEYFGRWIRHGDWYPDYQTRLWQRGKATWGGFDPHDKLIPEGTVGKLRGDLLHLSMDSYEQMISKTIAYADDFARYCVNERKRVTILELYLRPVFRFIRSYVLRLGFLDGWQGYSIAWMAAFYTFLRYAKARAALAEAARTDPEQ
jgi:glycosyltransferase involved in cell wall biosynthesis